MCASFSSHSVTSSLYACWRELKRVCVSPSCMVIDDTSTEISSVWWLIAMWSSEYSIYVWIVFLVNIRNWNVFTQVKVSNDFKSVIVQLWKLTESRMIRIFVVVDNWLNCKDRQSIYLDALKLIGCPIDLFWTEWSYQYYCRNEGRLCRCFALQSKIRGKKNEKMCEYDIILCEIKYFYYCLVSNAYVYIQISCKMSRFWACFQ